MTAFETAGVSGTNHNESIALQSSSTALLDRVVISIIVKAQTVAYPMALILADISQSASLLRFWRELTNRFLKQDKDKNISVIDEEIFACLGLARVESSKASKSLNFSYGA